MAQLFKVPIRNLFCILSYMNEMPELVKSLSAVDEDLITYDFLAKQFLKEVESLKHRGFVRDYVVIKESTSHLGGRVMMNDSMPYIVARQPVVVCEKDQYSANILFNQVMKSTLKAISGNRYVKEETRRRSFSFLDYLPEVDSLHLTKEIFSKVYYGRHNVHYKRMIHIARLLHEFTILSHKHGNWSLFSAEVDENSLNQIFEKFLYHFYRIEKKDYLVSSEVMQWQLEGNRAFLPTMKTDISLTHKNGKQKIVIDAKFYKNMFQENFGKASFHSHNLYQLFTYLMHQPKELQLRGILIYPFNGREVDETYRWDERIRVEVKTINLDDSWSEIYSELFSFIK
jgi:5-methylcytosine-specific restriction enzyme subunit McrC